MGYSDLGVVHLVIIMVDTVLLSSHFLVLDRMKLLLPPSSNSLDGSGDSQELIRTKAFQNGVLALPGTVFFPNGQTSAYVRLSFSLVSEDQIDEGLRRLGEVLRAERKAAGMQLPINGSGDH